MAPDEQYAICFVGMPASLWYEILGVNATATVETVLTAMLMTHLKPLDTSGKIGGSNRERWTFDQRHLYRLINNLPDYEKRFFFFNAASWDGTYRLDRQSFDETRGKLHTYSDAHLPLDTSTSRQVGDVMETNGGFADFFGMMFRLLVRLGKVIPAAHLEASREWYCKWKNMYPEGCSKLALTYDATVNECLDPQWCTRRGGVSAGRGGASIGEDLQCHHAKNVGSYCYSNTARNNLNDRRPIVVRGKQRPDARGRCRGVAPHRVPTSGIITGDGLRWHADFQLDQTEGCGDWSPNDLVPGSVVFVKPERLQDFFAMNLPYPYVLITHNSDDSEPGKFVAELERPNLLAWFGQNVDANHPKMRALPIGLQNSHISFVQQEELLPQLPSLAATPKNNTVFASFQFNGNAERTHAMSTLTANLPTSMLVSLTDRVEGLAYWHELSRHKWVVSPRGHGSDCHRTWEALLVGCYVITSDKGLDGLLSAESVAVQTSTSTPTTGNDGEANVQVASESSTNTSRLSGGHGHVHGHGDLPIWNVESWEQVTSDAIAAKEAEFDAIAWSLESLQLDVWLQRIWAVASRPPPFQ